MSERGQSSTTTRTISDLVREVLKLVDPRIETAVADFLGRLPRDVLQMMIQGEPDSLIEILKPCYVEVDILRRTAYATWIKRRMVVPEYMNNVKWIDLFGLARDQGEHEVCWAIVAAELIEALRKIHGHPDTNYSPQDLIDFADPKLRNKENKRGHYCYGFCVELALRHVLIHGIQKEVDRPFTGCSRSIPQRTQSECAHIAAVRICDDVERIFPALRHRPVKATIPMFLPEYKYIGDKIYHGPRKAGSRFVGLHSVTLVATGEEDGERYVLARSSHGPTFGCLGGYIKVSLDTRILHLPLPGETVDIMDRLFSKPKPLLWNFVYAKLPPGDERRKKKRKLV